MSNCPVCGRAARVHDEEDFKLIKCDICGQFYMDDDLYDENTGSIIKFKDIPNYIESSMFYYLTNFKQDNKIEQKIYPFFCLEDDEEGIREIEIYGNIYQFRYIQLKSLLIYYPNNFSQRIDMVLINLSKLVIKYSDCFLEKYNDLKATVIACFLEYSNNDALMNNELFYLFILLEEMGLLKRNNKLFSISANGYKRIQQLQEENKIIQQGFIAMWFDPQMLNAREKIIKAIHECGYKEMLIDIKEHNNQIVPEIFYEIKRSRFVIADLTGHRSGVYYEAGYAQALEKEVILTCKKDDFEKRHFDVAQKNTIVWEDEEDLYKRLCDRIAATVGRLK